MFSSLRFWKRPRKSRTGDNPGIVPGLSRHVPEIFWELCLCASFFSKQRATHKQIRLPPFPGRIPRSYVYWFLRPPIFLWGKGLLCVAALFQGNGSVPTVPISVPGKMVPTVPDRNFRFPVPVGFLRHPERSVGSGGVL